MRVRKETMSAGRNSGGPSAGTGHGTPDTENHKLMSVLSDFVTAASFQPVEKIITSAWTQHAPFAFWLVDALQPRCLVELGVFYGFSYLALCQAAARLTPNTRCFGIDNWRGDEHA